MSCVERSYTLGLDIGMASVGAALLADDQIIDLFVRTFDKAETAKEGEPLNKIRREARLTRRRIRRRSHRLLRLRRFFKRSGMLANFLESQSVSQWQLRAEGLDRLLDPAEWASVLYHLVKHRGFQSTRKSELKADAKIGEMLSGVTENHDLLASYRSVGEMAWKDERFRENKRNKGGNYSHTFARADLVDELRLLVSQQQVFGNNFAGAATLAFVENLLLARRPAFAGAALLNMVGKCTFEPTEYRAPKACYSAERFVWLTRLLNLRIAGIGSSRELNDDERDLLLELPFTMAKLTYKQVRTKLKLEDAERFSGVDYRAKEGKDPEAATFFEAKSFHKLRSAYEKAGFQHYWNRDSRNKGRLNDLAYALTVYKEDNDSRKWLVERGVEPEIIEVVLEISFSDFVRLSVKALDKIVPEMEKGSRYDEAVPLAGYQHHSQTQISEKSKYIPKITKDDIPNPVVYRALNQARKVVNEIIRKYGSPSAVNIELARDLNKPFDERKRIEKEQKNFRENKEKNVSEFEQLFKQPPKGVELLKWRLYREQNSQCAYSQKPLDLHRLFEPGYAEVDHALAYSRSFDDGMNNKVLVLTKENRDKGNRTPYEYLNGAADSLAWQRFVAWVMGNKSYRLAKRQRLLRKDFGEEEASKFSERNLTDTRYAGRKFKQIVESTLQLAKDSDKRRCVVVSGQLTSYLRARWGLLKVREEGDLHHALDAAVIAACTHGMVKRLSDYSRRKELELVSGSFVDPLTGEILDEAGLNLAEKHFPQPWEGFRKELEARLSPDPAAVLPRLTGVQPVRVSRAPKRRGLGAAHQETVRSAKMLGDGLSSVKTPLESLSLKDLPNIVGCGDPRNKGLMDAIEQRLRDHSDDGKKAFREPLRRPAAPGKESLAPIVRSVRLQTTQKSGLILQNRGGGVVNNGDMLRIDIFVKGGKFYPVPLYVADAAKKVLPNLAVVANRPEAEWTLIDESYQFLFSLFQNDWVRVSFKNEPIIEGYYAGMDRSTGAIHVWAHDRNRAVGKDGLIRSVGIKTSLSIEKFNVDVLGNIYRVRNETRQPLRLR